MMLQVSAPDASQRTRWAKGLLVSSGLAALMGGTLPPLIAAIRPREDTLGRASGQLYAANTAGAIAGALLTVFWVVPTFGIH